MNDIALFLELQGAKMPEEVSFSRHQSIQQKSDLPLQWSRTPIPYSISCQFMQNCNVKLVFKRRHSFTYIRRSLCLSRAHPTGLDSVVAATDNSWAASLPSSPSPPPPPPSPSPSICSYCPPPLLSFFHVRFGGGNRPSHIMTTCWAVGRLGREQRDGTKAAAVEGRERVLSPLLSKLVNVMKPPPPRAISTKTNDFVPL